MLSFLILVVIYLGLGDFRNDKAFDKSKPFNKDLWLSGNQRARGEMVNDIIATHILLGKSKADILSLLGQPTASDTISPLVYEVDLGMKTGLLGLGGNWPFFLTVQFDPIKNKVSDFWCRD